MGNTLEFDTTTTTAKKKKKKRAIPEDSNWHFNLGEDGLFVNRTKLTDVPLVVQSRWKHVQSEADLRFAPKMGVFLDFYENGEVVRTEQIAYDDLATDQQLYELIYNLGYSVSLVAKYEGTSHAKVIRHFIKTARPKTTYRIHTHGGWSDKGDLFVAGPELIPASTGLDRGDSKQTRSIRPPSGTYNQWEEHVARPIMKQEHAAYQWAISLPLGALLMPLVGFPLNSRGGFHVFGHSSTGKSKMLDIACSVMGDLPNTWETTSSKLEIVASQHNHRLLCLDEIGQAKKSEVVESAYKLAQGVGRSRTNQNLENIEPFTFELMFLSTGESSFADVVRKETGEDPFAGQKIRFCDIEWNSDITKWWKTEDLRKLEDSVEDYHGTMGREFITILAANETKSSLTKRYREERNKLVDGEDNPKFCRVANRFALCILGAKLAKEYGLLPAEWDAEFGPTAVFESWKKLNGEIDERIEAAKALMAAIDIGRANNRFHRKVESMCALESVAHSHDVLGFLEAPGPQLDDTSCFLFPEAFRKLIGDKNPNSIRRFLAEEGALIKSKRGFTRRMGRVTYMGSSIASEQTNVYHISLAKLAAITTPQDVNAPQNQLLLRDHI